MKENEKYIDKIIPATCSLRSNFTYPNPTIILETIADTNTPKPLKNIGYGKSNSRNIYLFKNINAGPTNIYTEHKNIAEFEYDILIILN